MFTNLALSKMRISSVFCLITCLLFSSWAASMTLQGASVYQRLDNDVYLASIHSSSSDSAAWLNSTKPLRLEMRILAMELSPRRFYRLWNEGLAINLTQRQMNEQVDELTRFMYLLKDDLVEGDHVVISNETGQTRVSINGVELLVVEKPGMVASLLTAWIGRYPRSQRFKDRLVSMSGSDRSSMETQMAAMTVDSSRVAVIEEWVAKKKEKDNRVAAAEREGAGELASGAAAGSAIVSGVSLGADSSALPAASSSEPVEEVTETAALLEGVEAGPSAAELEAQRLAEEAEKRQLAEEVERERQEQMRRVEQQLVEAGYYRNILKLANGKVKYPRSALKRKLQGVARVSIVLARDGRVMSSIISETSEHLALDKAAENAAMVAAPYPAIPEIMEGDEFEFDIPFRFVMRSK